MTEHPRQRAWDAAQWEHDAEVITISASCPDKEWIVVPHIKGWVRRQDA
jgi:hypothetical protein